MVVQNGRALHFVFKVGDRAKTAKFYMTVLGMKVCVKESRINCRKYFEDR